MVSTKVTIETKSYKKDARAVMWESESGVEFKISTIDKSNRSYKGYKWISLLNNKESYNGA
jgi:molecular chaperone HtpG